MASALAVVTAIGVATPARAQSVTVKFGLSVGTYAPTGDACPVSVTAGSDGIAVLDAAVAKGCISSYEKHLDPNYGYFVDCIDGICGTPATYTYWAEYENGKMGNGVSEFRAAEGKDLSFAYTTWAAWPTCMLPSGCLP